MHTDSAACDRQKDMSKRTGRQPVGRKKDARWSTMSSQCHASPNRLGLGVVLQADCPSTSSSLPLLLLLLLLLDSKRSHNYKREKGWKEGICEGSEVSRCQQQEV